ncbi:hypothetical protein [Paraferrimonas haliotis]|uniref:hypothetical protein n=1 Tax=Paraferrimonas haliotis TaxID=2013866 RepID=UPI000BA95E72|nr:hypothetical protein [Paraferrimonas haliotis]
MLITSIALIAGALYFFNGSSLRTPPSTSEASNSTASEHLLTSKTALAATELSAKAALAEPSVTAANSPKECIEATPKQSIDPLVFKQQVTDAISQSDTDDSRIVHSLLSNNSVQDKLAVLHQNSTQETSPIAAYNLLSYCTNPSAECSKEMLADIALIEEQNSASLLLLAMNQFKLGDDEAGEQLLIAAANAPHYNDYWGEHHQHFDAAFEQSGMSEHFLQAVTLFQAHLPLPNYRLLVDYCKSAERSPASRVPCQQMGERLESANGTAIANLIGMNLQKTLHMNAGELAQANEMAAKADALMSNATKAFSTLNNPVLSAQQARTYFNELQYSGEQAAGNLLLEIEEELEHTAQQSLCL